MTQCTIQSIPPHDISISLGSEADTLRIAQVLARHINGGVIYLIGELGSGKTTLTRAWLQSLGHQGNVKSPTYTLVEPYIIAGQTVYHFDLYRLNDPYELELMGIRDYLRFDSQMVKSPLLIIEWPQKGEPVLPAADYTISLQVGTDQQTRQFIIHSIHPQQSWLALYKEVYEQFN